MRIGGELRTAVKYVQSPSLRQGAGDGPLPSVHGATGRNGQNIWTCWSANVAAVVETRLILVRNRPSQWLTLDCRQCKTSTAGPEEWSSLRQEDRIRLTGRPRAFWIWMVREYVELAKHTLRT